MSSNYKKINGKNYVKSMLETAENCGALKKGSKLSLTDAKSIFKDISGDSLTETEIRTASYILEKYSFSEAALKWIEKAVSPADSESEIPESYSAEQEILTYREDMPDYRTHDDEKPSNYKKFIMFILLISALIAAAVIFMMNKNKQVAVPLIPEGEKKPDSEKNEQGKEQPERGAQIAGGGTAAETVKEEPGGRLYIVKHGDTLVKISIDIYKDYSRWRDIYSINRDIINDPGMVYPGQKLRLPE